MTFKPRPINDQVIVITGATSGIGLCTAKMAASRGAKLVLAARNENDLLIACEEVRALGSEALHVVVDVGDPEAVQGIADTAVTAFGRVDTWVNNAGASIYGRAIEVDLADMRRLFETDFWGVVYGSRVAVGAMREAGGVLVNIGSAACDRAAPLQSIYSASKHAVKAFTDALRVELTEDNLPVAVSLVKPSAVDTPFIKHAKNYTSVEPDPPSPVYDPNVVAEAILACAERPCREVTVGFTGATSALGGLAPGLSDKLLRRAAFGAQRGERPTRHRDTLYGPTAYDGGERGGYQGRVLRSSAFTAVRLRPVTTLTAIGLGLTAFGLVLAASPRKVRRIAARPTRPINPPEKANDPSYVRLADGI